MLNELLKVTTILGESLRLYPFISICSCNLARHVHLEEVEFSDKLRMVWEKVQKCVRTTQQYTPEVP